MSITPWVTSGLTPDASKGLIPDFLSIKAKSSAAAVAARLNETVCGARESTELAAMTTEKRTL